MSTSNDVSADIPEGWTWIKMLKYPKIAQHILFTYSIIKVDNGIYCPVTQNSVTLDADGILQYLIYGRHIDTQDKNLDRVLKKKEMLKNILIKFQGMNICSGLGDINIHVVPGDTYQDSVDKWRSKDCSLLSKKKTCDFCMKLRKCILQRKARMKNRPMMKRIGNMSNPVDRFKLLAMRMKIRRERSQKIRTKNRVKHLITYMKAQEVEMARMQDTAVDKKLAELDNISKSQKLVVKEIFAAARKRNARDRRYTDEWIMLCLLLNIRSPSEYEFLRKNNILPLPCTKTIRSYFSLINIKCGFDEDFSKLIEKHFASKTPLQRHGVLLLDEINLRKSVAVCSRNLTYVGLTDFGNDGQQSTDINEQATHGLVLMFQPLADVYTQPIAVFASKNSIKGKKLAKIVIKAISYLEQCGAIIHGVIADGATTNAKMWSLLGIKGTIENTKTWFTHPLNDERKIFVFSDVCHLIKNVRNRLYNKRKLRVS